MNLAFTVSSSNDRTKKKGRHSHRFQDDGPKQSFKMLKDENGVFLKPPKFLPSGRLAHQSISLIDDSSFVRANRIPHDAFITELDLLWLPALLHLHGGFPPPQKTLDLSWSNEEQEATRSFWRYVMDHAFVGAAPRKRIRHRLPRNGAKKRRPWTTATGTPEQLEEQANMYLRLFDHENARYFDQPELTLSKVVSNLRNYHKMSKKQTVMLMQALFNPKLETPWSIEAISLTWDLVADFTPWLGLQDIAGVAMQKAVEIEDAVIDLLAYTRSGHRATTDEFFAAFQAWNPDLKTTKTAVSRAVHEVAGIEATPYREGRCYPGFHLPTPEELKDPAHAMGDDLGIDLDPIIERLRSLRRVDLFIDFNISMSIYKKVVYSFEKETWLRKTVIRPIKPFEFSDVSPLWIHVFAADHLVEQERVKILDFVKQKQQSKALPNFKIA